MKQKIIGELKKHITGSNVRMLIDEYHLKLFIHTLHTLQDEKIIEFHLENKHAIIKILKGRQNWKRIKKKLKYVKGKAMSSVIFKGTKPSFKKHYYIMKDEEGDLFRVPPTKLRGLNLKRWIELDCKLEKRNVIWIYAAKNV